MPFHNLVEFNSTKLWKKFNRNQIKFEFKEIESNWIETSNENTNHVESKGGEYCVQFNSLQSRNLNSNQIQLNCIQFKLHYTNLFNHSNGI